MARAVSTASQLAASRLKKNTGPVIMADIRADVELEEIPRRRNRRQHHRSHVRHPERRDAKPRGVTIRVELELARHERSHHRLRHWPMEEGQIDPGHSKHGLLGCIELAY